MIWSPQVCWIFMCTSESPSILHNCSNISHRQVVRQSQHTWAKIRWGTVAVSHFLYSQIKWVLAVDSWKMPINSNRVLLFLIFGRALPTVAQCGCELNPMLVRSGIKRISITFYVIQECWNYFPIFHLRAELMPDIDVHEISVRHQCEYFFYGY